MNHSMTLAILVPSPIYVRATLNSYTTAALLRRPWGISSCVCPVYVSARFMMSWDLNDLTRHPLHVALLTLIAPTYFTT